MINSEVLKNKVLLYALSGQILKNETEEDVNVLFNKIKEYKKKNKINQNIKLKEIKSEDKYFDIPQHWIWVHLGEIFDHTSGKALNSDNHEGKKIKYITTSNVYWDHFDLDELKEMYYTDKEINKYTLKKGDLLVLEGGDIGRSAIWDNDNPFCFQNHIHRLRSVCGINVKYYYYILYYLKTHGLIDGKGIGMQGLTSNKLHNIIVPLPSLAEQKNIASIIEKCFDMISKINNSQTSLLKNKSILKEKLIEGMINKQKEYTKTQDLALEKMLDYVQPQPYIVKELDFDNTIGTPILTPGKTFILGYTQEKEVYQASKEPIILFDDFTTESKYVDFDFKVKSSASKILINKDKTKYNLKYIYYMMQNIDFDNANHKRFWIRKYSKILIKIPEIEIQNEIVNKIDSAFKLIEVIDKL